MRTIVNVVFTLTLLILVAVVSFGILVPIEWLQDEFKSFSYRHALYAYPIPVF